MKWTFLLSILLVVFLVGCSNQPDKTSVPQNDLEQMNAGRQFVEEILGLVQGNSGWVPPLPPSGGEKPRILTQEEKSRVIKIASAFSPVVEAKQNKDVVSVETQFLWVGWNGHSDGVSYLSYEAVEKGTVSSTTLLNMGDKCYPAAQFTFHSRYGKFGIAGIQVAVNLRTEKVVWLGGYTSSPPVPPRLPR